VPDGSVRLMQGFRKTHEDIHNLFLIQAQILRQTEKIHFIKSSFSPIYCQGHLFRVILFRYQQTGGQQVIGWRELHHAIHGINYGKVFQVHICIAG